jgi:hypothetical protein
MTDKSADAANPAASWSPETLLVHGGTLRSPFGPSAPAKKSISSACWPIFACRSFNGTASVFAPRSAPDSNTSSARFSNWDFHCVT